MSSSWSGAATSKPARSCPKWCWITREAVRELHREFLRAGAEVMVALTYYGDREKLKTMGRETTWKRSTARRCGWLRRSPPRAKPWWRATSATPGSTTINDKEDTSQKVRQIYDEQVGWAVDEGVDFIIAETLDYLGEGLLALEVIKEFGLPAMITFGSAQDTLRDGYTYVEACKIMEKEGAEVVGLNCSRGPATMLPLLHEIRQAVSWLCGRPAGPLPHHRRSSSPSRG